MSDATRASRSLPAWPDDPEEGIELEMIDGGCQRRGLPLRKGGDLRLRRLDGHDLVRAVLLQRLAAPLGVRIQKKGVHLPSRILPRRRQDAQGRLPDLPVFGFDENADLRHGFRFSNLQSIDLP